MQTNYTIFFGWNVNKEVIEFLRRNYNKKQGEKLNAILNNFNEDTLEENINMGNKMLNKLNKRFNCKLVLQSIKLKTPEDYELRYFITLGENFITMNVDENNSYILEKKLIFMKKWIKMWHKIKCDKQFKTPLEPTLINYISCYHT